MSANAEIFSTLVRMYDDGQPVDSLLLCEEIDVESVGGYGYIADLTTGVIVLESHILERCRLLIRKAQLRRIIAIAAGMDAAARQRGAVPEDIITKTVQELESINSSAAEVTA